MRTSLMVLLLVPSIGLADKADKTAEELKAAHHKLDQAWQTGDAAAFKAGLADKIWGSWDMDEMGRPNSQATQAEVVKIFDDMQKMMKNMGAKVTSTEKLLECHGSGDLGVCIHEGEMTMTAEKMPPVTMSFRETNVFKKEKSGWKAVHHHGSLAKYPDFPPKSVAMTAKSAQWMDVPGRPGMKMSPIWMNPVTQGMVGLMKVTTEMKQAKHFHPYAAAFYVIEGAMITTINGKDTEFGPGSIVYRSAKEVHTTTLKANSIVFAVADGPIVEVYVDDKGNPLPQTAQK